MPIQKMPLRWSDNCLAYHPKQMFTNYRFQTVSNTMICEFPDHVFQAPDAYELAALLVADGIIDGTVQVNWKQRGLIERFESLHGMAARFRVAQGRLCLNIPQDRLAPLFTKNGRGLGNDVQAWWDDALGPTSIAWRFRRYLLSSSTRRAHRNVEELLEFGTVADMILFKLRWL